MIIGAYLAGSNQKRIIETFPDLNLKYKTFQRVINRYEERGTSKTAEKLVAPKNFKKIIRK